jgi:uncharacterized oligopeptide transporter (OPT) family protein
MLTAYKWIISCIGFVAAILLLRAALVNLGRVRKKNYATFGAPMCVFMLIMGIVIAALSGYFIAM